MIGKTAAMKFRAPPHCCVVSHGGTPLAVAPDGSIEAPEAEAALLLAHGITPWAPAAPPASPLARPLSDRAIEVMSREAVIAALATMGRAPSPSTRTAELRRTLRLALAARA
jgi:hypothetical protein